jgi:hypothetical protein
MDLFKMTFLFLSSSEVAPIVGIDHIIEHCTVFIDKPSKCLFDFLKSKHTNITLELKD